MPKEVFELVSQKTIGVPKLIFELLPVGKKGSLESMRKKKIQKTWKYEIDIVKHVNIERYITTKIYLYI